MIARAAQKNVSIFRKDGEVTEAHSMAMWKINLFQLFLRRFIGSERNYSRIPETMHRLR